MNREFVIYGASVSGIKAYKMLAKLDSELKYFVDGDESKWGTFIEEYEIKSPMSLLADAYLIVIGSVYQEEIEEKLIGIGVDLNRIITKEQLVKEYLDSRMQIYKKRFENQVLADREFGEVVIDLDHEIKIGGMESWSFNVATALIEQNARVTIITKNQETKMPDQLKETIAFFNMSKENFEEEVLKIAEFLVKKKPFVFIANWMEHSFWAAYIIKSIFPKQVYLVGVIHFDRLFVYRRSSYLSQAVDSFLCVSSGAVNRMQEEFGIDANQISYHEPPIRISELPKKIHDSSKPIVIGMGARLEILYKRVDLLIPLIEELQNSKAKFRLMIAGEGSYFEEIRDYVAKNQLEKEVTLFGKIEPRKMNSFWDNCDVVISTSDSEGMPLSILEAMSVGCVPVVTATNGMSDFVQNGVSGYIVPLYDMHSLAERIIFLSEKQELLQRLSENCRSIIEMRCNPKDYIEHIFKLSKFNFKEK